MELMQKHRVNIPFTEKEMKSLPKGITIPRYNYGADIKYPYRLSRRQLRQALRDERKEKTRCPQGYVPQYILEYNDKTDGLKIKTIFHYKSLSGGN